MFQLEMVVSLRNAENKQVLIILIQFIFHPIKF